MSGETNKLVGYVDELDADSQQGGALDDEYDAIVSSGEQVTSGLLAIALRRRGLKARSWLGWQIPLRTDMAHSKARIEGIETTAMDPSLANGTVGVVAGFQGISEDGRISTIYTDVDGIYTTDPRIADDAKRLDKIAFEEMLELASLGAKVLQTRSVELAMNNNLPIRVLTSFAEEGQDNPGTIVCNEEETMEERVVSGVGYDRSRAFTR